MKRILTLLGAAFIALSCYGQNSFEIKDGEFLKDGKPIYLIKGELHYSRIPKEYWRHRIQMAKAMGVNAISTYVFGNAHESNPRISALTAGRRSLVTPF